MKNNDNCRINHRPEFSFGEYLPYGAVTKNNTINVIAPVIIIDKLENVMIVSRTVIFTVRVQFCQLFYNSDMLTLLQ